MNAQDYFYVMQVEPTPYGIMRWINQCFDEDLEFDQKICRRLIEALIELSGGSVEKIYHDAMTE